MGVQGSLQGKKIAEHASQWKLTAREYYIIHSTCQTLLQSGRVSGLQH